MPHRHVILVLLVALGLITFLDRICISVAGARIMGDLSLDAAQWGWVQSVFILAYGLFQMPIGALADRRGQRTIAALIVIWWSLFTALTGAAGGFVSLLALRFLFGLGEAGAYPVMTGVIAQWFPASERAVAQGFVWGASRLGGALSPILVVPLQQAYGWRVAFQVLAVAGVVWGIVWLVVYRDKPKPAEERPRTPWRTMFGARGFWMLMAMYFCYVWGSWFYFTWMPTYLQKGRGFAEDEMKLFASLPFFLGMASNVAGGFLSDFASRRFGKRVGRLAVGSVSLALAAICVAAVALADDRRAVVIFLTLGFGVMDLMLPAAWAICLDIGGAHAGALSGAMNTAGSAGGFLCATLFGAVVNATGDYNLPVLCIAGMLAISALLFTRLDPERPIAAG